MEALLGKVIFLDTAPLIYFIEGHSKYEDQLLPLFEAADEGKIAFITSSITLVEVLVGPYKAGRSDVAAQYQQILLHSSAIEVIVLSNEIALRAAALRAAFQLRSPDAIQIATCIESEADFFLTNDLKLRHVTGINVLTLADLE
jgi:predicted nucleic acid-binding protein